VTPETIENIATMLDTAAMTMSAEGFHVQLLITLAVPTDEVLYGVFIAYSAHSVVLACEQAGIPVERLTADVLLGSTRRHGGRAEAAHADG
jgi:hypothetical protein